RVTIEASRQTRSSRSSPVMLSEAKHLSVPRDRPLASPSLRSGLRLAQGDNRNNRKTVGADDADEQIYPAMIRRLVSAFKSSFALSAHVLDKSALYRPINRRWA